MLSGSNFVHVPLTGGHTICSAIAWPDASHLRASAIKAEFLFTVVRNPYDRAVALYNNLCIEPIRHPDYKEAVGEHPVFKLNSFKNWCKEGFTDFTGIERGTSWYGGTEHEFLFACPMVDFLDAPVDYILKFEGINNEFNSMCEKLGVENKLVWRDTVPDYQRFYDDEVRELVAIKYADDLKQFGYSF